MIWKRKVALFLQAFGRVANRVLIVFLIAEICAGLVLVAYQAYQHPKDALLIVFWITGLALLYTAGHYIDKTVTRFIKRYGN